MRYFLLFTFFLFFTKQNICHSQNKYFVKDGSTKLAIPFVKVYSSNGKNFLSDLDGMFEVNDSIKYVKLKSLGYKDTTIYLERIENSIFLDTDILEIEEVVIFPGVNPAHRIIKNAQDNRKKNHPLKNVAFVYNSYSKFIFDVNQDRLKPKNDEDSVSIKLQNYFKNQHLFVMENATKRTFHPPGKDVEQIIAYKVSGLSDPMLSTFAQDMQSFNFYDNEFSIIGETFINPIAKDGLKRYLFILEDTLLHNRDTTFTIFFRPRKGKYFKGLSGYLYINTNGFAIEKVKAQAWKPNKEGVFDVSIIQEYELINNKRWFPIKLSTELTYGDSRSDDGTSSGLISGYGHTYIDSVVLNPSQKPKRFYDNYHLSTSPNANVSIDELQKYRVYDLNEKELRTHLKADSISKENKILKRLSFAKELAKGKIQLGKISLPLNRLMAFNQYEKFRFGLGLESSVNFLSNYCLGGYFAYGTGDMEFKYGVYSTIKISKKHKSKFDFIYRQDVIERGGLTFTENSFNLNNTEFLRALYIQQMDRQRIAEITFSTDIKANINVRLFSNYQRVTYTNGYEYKPKDSLLTNTRFASDLAGFGVELKWNIGERYMLLGETKVSQGLKYPSIKFKAVRGLKGLWESEFDYWRLNLSISQKLKVRDYFSVNLNLSLSKTIGDVPLFLMHNGRGTKSNWNINTANTFQTMFSGSYYSSSQIALFTSIKLKSFHTKADWNEPQISFCHAIGYGEIKNDLNHNIDFMIMNKGYLEAGVILDNCYTFNRIPIGIGVFYNYGPTRDENWKNNIVPKISMSISL